MEEKNIDSLFNDIFGEETGKAAAAKLKDSPPPIPSSKIGSMVGAVPGNILGTNAAVKLTDSVINAAPIPAPLKAAARLAVGYYGGKVGGGLGGGLGALAGRQMETNPSTTTLEDFGEGMTYGDEASSGPLNLLNVPFVGGKPSIPSIKGVVQEIVGTNKIPLTKNLNTARDTSPQTALEWAANKFDIGIPRNYNKDEVVMRGKGVSSDLPGSKPVTNEDIQNLQMMERGEPLSEAFIGDPHSGNASFIRSHQLGKVRRENQKIVNEVENRIANVDNPHSVFAEIMPKTGLDLPTQINESEIGNLYGSTIGKAKNEAMSLYRGKIHDLTILGRDPQTGQKLETTLPNVSSTFHILAKNNAGSSDYDEVFGKIMRDAASNDPYAGPLARAVVNGESIPLEDLSKLRPYLTHIANPTHGANIGGSATLATTLDNEISSGAIGQSLPAFAKTWNEMEGIYNKISPHISWDTLSGQASSQAGKFFSPRPTEPKLKFESIVRDNPEFLTNAVRLPNDFDGLVAPSTKEALNKTSSQLRQWRLNTFLDEAKGTKSGPEGLRSQAKAWEALDRPTAAAIVGENNIEKVNTLFGTALKVAESGGANPERIEHLGRSLMFAGGIASLGASAGLLGSGAGNYSALPTLLYYGIAYGYPAVRSRIISSPELMHMAINGVHHSIGKRAAETATAQFLTESGVGEQLYDDYKEYTSWIKQKGIKLGEKFGDFLDEKYSSSSSSSSPVQLESIKKEGEVTVDPHGDIDSYLEQFK